MFWLGYCRARARLNARSSRAGRIVSWPVGSEKRFIVWTRPV